MTSASEHQHSESWVKKAARQGVVAGSLLNPAMSHAQTPHLTAPQQGYLDEMMKGDSAENSSNYDTLCAMGGMPDHVRKDRRSGQNYLPEPIDICIQSAVVTAIKNPSALTLFYKNMLGDAAGKISIDTFKKLPLSIMQSTIDKDNKDVVNLSDTLAFKVSPAMAFQNGAILGAIFAGHTYPFPIDDAIKAQVDKDPRANGIKALNPTLNKGMDTAQAGYAGYVLAQQRLIQMKIAESLSQDSTVAKR